LNLQIRLAAQAIEAGGVIAYPTEAVWGLGCDPFNPIAVERLLRLKARPLAKGLILVAAHWQQLDWLLHDLTPAQQSTMKETWPGPNTWLVPHRGRVPQWLSGNFDTIAVRVSAHPTVIQLCLEAGGPLVSTSANLATTQAATQIFQVRRYFGKALDYIVPGALGKSTAPSIIRDLRTGQVIRAG
jgi:L-threonylcarbamoyladenylate synthase